ncbi:MAG: hypothetical protein IJM54_07895 [Thermoguttaceae bacterium]|nr:hypothetical protein [Thermoguttaceae bacterium]
MVFPLSKYELTLFEELKNFFEQDAEGRFSEQECQKWQDFLSLMTERGLLWTGDTMNGTLYNLKGDFDIFERWLFDENAKAKRLSKREWKISLASVVIGAILSEFVRWIISIL